MPTIGVSIAIPEPYGPQLRQWRRDLGDPMADAIPTHVTLLRPLEVAAADLEPVHKHLREVAAEQQPFTMALRGTGTFRPTSPVVFVQVAVGLVECEMLEAAVRCGPLERDLDFHYHPHVTIAHHLPDASLDRAFVELAEYHCEFKVAGFDLYEHGTDGVWRSVATFNFEGPVATPELPARSPSR